MQINGSHLKLELLKSDNVTRDSLNVTMPVTMPPRYIFGGLLCILVITGSIGNGLVIIVTAVDRKLRTLSHNLIAALSITDFVICALFLPMCVIRLLNINENRRLCFLTSFLSPILTILSTQIQALLSVARYNITTSRGQTLPRFRKTMYGALGFCVLMDTALYCTFVAPGGDIQYNPYLGICSRKKPVFPGQPISFVVLFYLAAFLTIIFYIKIRRFVANFSFSFNSKQQRQNRLSRLLCRLAVAWITGYSFVIIIRFLDKEHNLSLLIYQAAYFILWANSCINPIMYNSNNEQFSKAFSNLFKSTRKSTGRFNGPLISNSSSATTQRKHEVGNGNSEKDIPNTEEDTSLSKNLQLN